MRDAEFKPCPFCGYSVNFGDGADTEPVYSHQLEAQVYVITCPDCVRSSVVEISLEEAIKAWNTRAVDKEIHDLLIVCYNTIASQNVLIDDEYDKIIGRLLKVV